MHKIKEVLTILIMVLIVIYLAVYGIYLIDKANKPSRQERIIQQER